MTNDAGLALISHVLFPSVINQPPLPEEDYPASPEPEEGTSPLPAEYSLINVRKVSIPRANLDRSSPAGWTLNIDPDGVWVFTSDYTQEQVQIRRTLLCPYFWCDALIIRADLLFEPVINEVQKSLPPRFNSFIK